MPGNGTRYSRADSRAEVKNFIWIERKPDIELVGGHIEAVVRKGADPKSSSLFCYGFVMVPLWET